VVDTNSISLVVGDIAADSVGNITLIAEVCLRYIIRHFRLKEKRLPALPIPLHLICQAVFNFKAISRHIIPINDGTHRTRVVSILYQATTLNMICTPQPSIVYHNIP
jgi:hypothetical protein